MKQFMTISLLFLSIQLANAQVKTWNFNQLDSLQRVEPRDVMVFLKTDWCKYCKTMDKTVFGNEGVGEIINENFWFIAFNGESQEPVTLGGKQYRFRPTGLGTGVHELAEAIGAIDGVVSYPTVVVLQPNLQAVFKYNAFLNREQMILLVNELTSR